MWIKIEANGSSKVLYCDTDSLLFSQCNLINIKEGSNFEEASEFFMAGKVAAVKPGYQHVEALVQGKHVYFMSWYMNKSRTRGITKEYCIKHLKP